MLYRLYYPVMVHACETATTGVAPVTVVLRLPVAVAVTAPSANWSRACSLSSKMVSLLIVSFFIGMLLRYPNAPARSAEGRKTSCVLVLSFVVEV